MMKRRQLVQSAGVAALGAMAGAAAERSAGATGRPKAPFRLWYNNDCTNVLSVNSPFHKRGEPMADAALIGSIDEVAGKGVDAYDRLLGASDRRCAWACPAALLKDGTNALRLTLAEGPAVTVHWLDLTTPALDA